MNSVYAARSPIYLTNPSFGLSFVRDALPGKRKKNIDFHVASRDYFGTLATIIGLIADALPSADDVVKRERYANSLRELRDDLSYLQQHHTIQPKK